MEVIIQQNSQQLSVIAAKIIRDAIRAKPDLVLGLATGSTPIGLYKLLVQMHQEKDLDFSRVVTFNLDEYIGIPQDHPQSYHTFMAKHFFDHVNIPKKNQFIPQNIVDNHVVFCQEYEDSIRSSGGIDIQVLGIGKDGHIGFNEPGSSFASRTRMATLSKSTLEANAVHFKDDINAVPEMAITMGIGTIMEAKQCLLLASGSAKKDAIAKTIEGPIGAMVPASALQMHPKTVFLIDEAAASGLSEIDYYKRAYNNKIKYIQPE
ncbi:glucosamine-6-phosphate deaminase [Candidatus Poribacteria bacterium]|nr:glucosamine-6-phosphate deaminase [Candidatus Poribacteria bacterium]